MAKLFLVLLFLSSCQIKYALKSGASVSNTSAITQKFTVYAGNKITCIRYHELKKAKCFGDNGFGQSGQGNFIDYGDDEDVKDVPFLDLGGDVLDLALGVDHLCALINDGDVKCWGRNTNGELGIGNTVNQSDASTVPAVDFGGLKAKKITAGWYHSCALLDNNKVRCWGQRFMLGLGTGAAAQNIGDNEAVSAGGDVTLGPGTVVDIVSNGAESTCALFDNKEAICWGEDYYGELGMVPWSSMKGYSAPLTGESNLLLTGIKKISKGYEHTCALLTNNEVHCWGYGSVGQLGTGNTSDVTDLTATSAVPLGSDEVIDISTGNGHSCAAFANGKIKCWGHQTYLGYNYGGHLGDDESVNTYAHLQLEADIIQISALHDHTCAVLKNNKVYCWGFAVNGEFGIKAQPQASDISDASALFMILE